MSASHQGQPHFRRMRPPTTAHSKPLLGPGGLHRIFILYFGGFDSFRLVDLGRSALPRLADS